MKGILELVLIGILYTIAIIVIGIIQLVHWVWFTIKEIKHKI